MLRNKTLFFLIKLFSTKFKVGMKNAIGKKEK